MSLLKEKLNGFTSPSQVSDPLYSIRAVFYHCLLYGNDPQDLPSSLKQYLLQDDNLADKVHAKLKDSFYSRIFIQRNEIDDIERLIIDLKKPLIIKGGRGSGKTTCLLKISKDFSKTSKSSIHYIDLRAYASKFERMTSRSEERKKEVRDAISSIVYRALREFFFQPNSFLQHGSEHVSLPRLFRIYRIQKDQRLERVKETILEEGNPRTDEEWWRAYEQSPYKNQLPDIEPVYTLFTEEDLKILLDFLYQKFGQHCVILLDNIDRYSLEIQKQVFDFILDLSPSSFPPATIVLTVRTGNFNRINPGGVSDTHFLVRNLEPVKDDESLLSSFMRKRLEFATDILKELFPPIQQFSSFHFKSYDGLVEKHMEGLRLVTEKSSHLNIVRMLFRWHNRSLRTTAISMFNLLNRFLSSTDPLFSYEKAVKEPPGDRELRTTFYRHMIFCGHHLPSDFPVPTLDSIDYKSISLWPAQFLFLKILNCIDKFEDDRCTYSEILRVFSDTFGVPQQTIFATLEKIASPRGFDNSGLINIDIDSNEFQSGMSASTVIELNPSGQFFLDKIATSCEYLFWVALYTTYPHSSRIISQQRIELDDVRSDEFRVRAASLLLKEHIFPCTKKEIEWIENQRNWDTKKFMQDYFHYFLTDRKLYPQRIAKELLAFADGRVSPNSYKELRMTLNEIQDQCFELMDDR